MIWFYFHFIILLFEVVTLRDVSFDTSYVLNAHLYHSAFDFTSHDNYSE